jgi:hypothetical protein
MGAHARASLFPSRRILLGTIEAGKLADFIVVSRNPLEDVRSLRAVETVVLNGRLVERGYHATYADPVGQFDLVVRNPDPIDPFFLGGCGGPARPTPRTFSSITVIERGEASC